MLVMSVVDGQLKKLYERIRNQREVWQQRSLHESQDIDECAVQEGSTGKAGKLLILCVMRILPRATLKRKNVVYIG